MTLGSFGVHDEAHSPYLQLVLFSSRLAESAWIFMLPLPPQLLRETEMQKAGLALSLAAAPILNL